MDAHVHIMAGGLTLQRVDLRAVDSKYGFAAAVKTVVGMYGSHSATQRKLCMFFTESDIWMSAASSKQLYTQFLINAFYSVKSQ